MKSRFRVGIMGIDPERSWGAIAHIPALKTLSNDFEIVGVANHTLESSQAAASFYDIPLAFKNPEALVNSAQIDVVSVTVKVPHHLELAKIAIEAGKHIYCEWPLGNGLEEAKELTALAKAQGVLAVIGTQARKALEVEYLAEIVANGYVGKVLSTTIVANGLIAGPQTEKVNAYLLDRKNGATLLTIPFSHTMAALQDVLGQITEVSAWLGNRRKSAMVIETGETLPMTSPDQVLMTGLLAGGVPIAVHYRGGAARGTGFVWQINGTEGDIEVTANSGHTQMCKLSICGGCGNDKTLKPIEVPADHYEGWPNEIIPRNVARVYAAMATDLRDGTHSAPSFTDAVALHQLINAIEVASETGNRITLASQLSSPQTLLLAKS